ncbi:MAG TPA: TolC family protein, partial [Gemmata sp.]|nr:TolC family protein [Gemmata sp.]
MNPTARLSKAKRTKRVIARAIACGMLLMVLPSCRIPFLRHPEQGLGIPPSFPEPATGSIPSLGGKIGGTLGAAIGAVANGVPGGALDGAMSGAFSTAIRATVNAETSQENSSQLSVDAFYNDPLLSQLIYQSVSGNRELRALEEEVQIARADILRRRGAYLPFVTFGARAGLEKPSLFMPDGAAEDQLLFPPGRHFPDPIGNFLASFNLFWQLDIWRELRNARDAAIQRYIAAIEKRNAFVTRLVAEVAENYFELMALDMRLVTLDQIIEFQQGSLRTAQLFFETGRGDDLAVQRFQAEVRKNQSEKLIVRQEIVQAENRINFLVGRFPQPVDRLSARFYGLTINALNVGVPAQLLQNRPDIRQAERELAAAGLDVRVARARFFPRVDMIAGIGYQAFNPRYLFNPDALI